MMLCHLHILYTIKKWLGDYEHPTVKVVEVAVDYMKALPQHKPGGGKKANRNLIQVRLYFSHDLSWIPAKCTLDMILLWHSLWYGRTQLYTNFNQVKKTTSNTNNVLVFLKVILKNFKFRMLCENWNYMNDLSCNKTSCKINIYHEAVASNLESGLNWQYEMGLVSPIWLQYIDAAWSFFCNSCLLAVRVASGRSCSLRASSKRCFARGNE
jgi:hypothetical protein